MDDHFESPPKPNDRHSAPATSQQDKEAFWEAIRKAILDQAVPVIFSAEQLSEMQKPYHERSDYFDNNLNVGHTIVATLGIYDPRVTEEQLAQAPKKVTVEFQGQSHDIPLRAFSYSSSQNVQAWEEKIAFKREGRVISEKLTLDLQAAFNLIRGTDFALQPRQGKDADGSKVVNLQVQFINAAALTKADEVKRFVEAKLPQLTEKPGKVTISGPVIAHGQ
jgi:hypothetical protein